jgi:RHS repeat-associated protein
MQVKKNNDADVVANYKYDAIGRRIEKVDAFASATTHYFYDGDRALVETDGSDTAQRYFVYGNYIDEVLLMRDIGGSADYYYGNDHLYSPCVLFNGSGTVVERYEYDAYGKPAIMAADYTTRTSSSYGNPYMFTGRNMDYLNSNNLTLQYNRNRYYSSSLGRWHSRDPLGVVPNAQKPNIFTVLGQYKDGMSLYEYVRSNSVNLRDPLGKFSVFGINIPLPTGPCYDITIRSGGFEIRNFKSEILDKWEPFVKNLTVADVEPGAAQEINKSLPQHFKKECKPKCACKVISSFNLTLPISKHTEKWIDEGWSAAGSPIKDEPFKDADVHVSFDVLLRLLISGYAGLCFN